MKKPQRALESMILTWVFILGIPALLIAILLFAKGHFISNVDNTNMIAMANNLASLILVIIELCAIAIAIVGLHYYFRYYRPSVFIFKGFSNASKLADIGHVSVDFDNLAREELAYQFRLVYERLQALALEQSSDDQEEGNTWHIDLSDLYTEETRPEDQDKWPLPNTDVMNAILDTEKAQRFVRNLKETIDSMKAGDLSDLMNAIERTAPKGIGPIMSLMDMIFPARSITITCHLQWDGNGSDRIGITFEVTDSKKKGGVSFTQTLWSDRAISTGEGTKLIASYIELLKPAMRWLALLYWEQGVWLDLPRENKKGLSLLFHQLVAAPGLSNNSKDDLRPAFLYLLGVLCYVSADQFPLCSEFFDQQAIRRLSRVASKYPNHSLPYFLRAEIDFCNAERKGKEGKDRDSYHLYQKAINSYDQLIDQPFAKKLRQDFKNWITIKRALAKLGLQDEELSDDTIQQIKDLVQEKGDPTTFYSEDGREECSLYLSNLATWYTDLANGYKGEEQYINEEKEVRTYARQDLLYSFVRYPRPWYTEEQRRLRRKEFDGFFDGKRFREYRLFEEDELDTLWNILEENRLKISALSTKKGKVFSHGVARLFGPDVWGQALPQEAETHPANTTPELSKV